jgi:hypothetical protein
MSLQVVASLMMLNVFVQVVAGLKMFEWLCSGCWPDNV